MWEFYLTPEIKIFRFLGNSKFRFFWYQFKFEWSNLKASKLEITRFFSKSDRKRREKLEIRNKLGTQQGNNYLYRIKYVFSNLVNFVAFRAIFTQNQKTNSPFEHFRSTIRKNKEHSYDRNRVFFCFQGSKIQNWPILKTTALWWLHRSWLSQLSQFFRTCRLFCVRMRSLNDELWMAGGEWKDTHAGSNLELEVKCKIKCWSW